MKKMRKLGRSVAMRIELDLTHLFTFGLQGSSYTNMDGETVSTTTGDGVQLTRRIAELKSLLIGLKTQLAN